MPQITSSIIKDLKQNHQVNREVAKTIPFVGGLRTGFLRAWIFTVFKVFLIVSILHGASFVDLFENNIALLDSYIRNDFSVPEIYFANSLNSRTQIHDNSANSKTVKFNVANSDGNQNGWFLDNNQNNNSVDFGTIAGANTTNDPDTKTSTGKVSTSYIPTIHNSSYPSTLLTEARVDEIVRYNIENSIAAHFLVPGTGDNSDGCLQIDYNGVVTTRGTSCSGGGGGGSTIITGSLNIGGAITGATSGSVLYVGASGALAEDNANFFYNDTTKSLTVGGSLTATALGGGGVQCIQTDNTGLLSGTGSACGSGGGSSALSGLTAGVATHSIDNTNNSQTWDWSTLTSQNALTLSASGAGLTSGSVLKVSSATTGAVTNGIVQLLATGDYSGTGGLLNVTATGTTSGTIAKITGSALTTGTLLKLSTGNSVVTSGRVLDISGTIFAPDGGADARQVNLYSSNFSSNVTGTSSTTAINIQQNNFAAGAGGTQNTYGISLAALGGFPGAGTQNNYGIQIGNYGQSGAENSYGLYVSPQSGSTNNYAAIFAGGNVGIGTTTPGSLLDVNGNINTSGDYTLDVGHYIKAGSYNQLEFWSGQGLIWYGDGAQFMSLYNASDGGGNLDLTGRDVIRTSGTSSTLSIGPNFSPTSGTGEYNSLELYSTINQTGGANGISRGIYINPILTSASDYRGVELANNSGFGIYQSGASAVNYFAGNVGIGVTNPTEPLQVNVGGGKILSFLDDSSANISSSGSMTLNASNGDNLLRSEYGGVLISAQGRLTGNGKVQFAASDGYDDSNIAMTILTGGNVGIGTTTPTAKLAINNSTSVIGPELVTNGTFTGSASGWSLGDCASYGSNSVTVTYTACNDPNLSTSINTVATHTYQLTFDVTATGDQVYIWFNNNGANYNEGPFSTGTHTVIFGTDYTGSDDIYFESWNWNNDATWTIDNVSIKEINLVPTLLVKDYNGNPVINIGSDLFNNTGLGANALHVNSAGGNNVAVGDSALYNNISGNYNSALGNSSLFNNTTGSRNSALGYQSLYSNIDGSENSAFGYYALHANTSGSNNLALSNYALASNTTGSSNVAVGYSALDDNNTGNANSALGVNTLARNTSGYWNVGVGASALQQNLTGYANVAIGNAAMLYNTTGDSNIAIGESALVGQNAGFAQTGYHNIAIGRFALLSNSSGVSNTAIGYETMHENLTGFYNTVVGEDALYGNNSGYGNVIVGHEAARGLAGQSDINESSILGFQAGYSLLTGGYGNMLFGYKAANNLTTGSRNIVIGYDVDAPTATSTQTLNIGNLIFGTGLDGSGTTLSSGNIGIGDSTPAAKLTVGNGDLFQVNSSGAIVASTGYIQGSGTMSVTSANTTQTTTASAMALNVNSLTTGTGLYLASSSLSSGALIDLAVTGTAGLTNQKGINVSTSGAVTGAQTTYGGYFSNTHTGASAVNVGLYATASGATGANYAAIFNAGNVGIGTTTPNNLSGSYFGASQLNPLWVSANDAAKVTAAVIQGNLGEAIQFVDQAGAAEADFGVYTTDIYFVNRQASGAIRFVNATSTAMYIDPNSNIGIGHGTTSPTSLLSVGSTYGFQVNTSGAIVASTGYIQGSGTMSVTSANTTQTTTASAMALNVNSLTTGTGLYLASSSLSSGALIDLAVTGTAGLTNQKGINVSLSGANGTGAQTTYGGYFSNTHTGTSNNVGLYATATGGTNNYAAVFAGGNVGIGTITPTTILEIGSSDLGNGNAGPVITLGRNTNATNTGAGSINFQSKAGTAGYVWQDNAGNMRINTAAPSNANDTAGTVIGTQTSTRNTKQDITDYTDYGAALQMVADAPLHTFRYIKDVQGYGESSPLAKARIGYIADEVPAAFMWGNSIDQVSVNGILMASVKALNNKIDTLTSQLQSLSNNSNLPVGQPNLANTSIVLASQLYLSTDNVGQAEILAGSTSVRISFEKPYQYQPVVTATPNSRVGSEFWIADKDSTGFTIYIDKSTTEDVIFDWHAFAGQSAKLIVSDGTSVNIKLIIPSSNSNSGSTEPVVDSSNIDTSSTNSGSTTDTVPQTDAINSENQSPTDSSPTDSAVTTTTDQVN